MVTGQATLHEFAQKSFNRTPEGLIFVEDLKAVYSILLICMDLQDRPKDVAPKLFNAFNKNFPYSFMMEDAVKKMRNLSLDVNTSATCMHISYNIKSDLARHLLSLFMDAKLLHTPADRTRDEPKENILLQPTPKGTAILQKYTRDIGLKKIPQILKSEINSMQLFIFERNSTTDAIIYSKYFIDVLFGKLMGPLPNIWSPTNSGDKLPPLATLLEHSDDTFTFENSYSSHQDANGHNFFGSNILGLTYDELNNTNRESPLAHRFFTNPDSDSHIQYYVSHRGMRLFKSRSFGKDQSTIDYSFHTKAIWQWLMDCTDIVYPKEAVSIASLFWKRGLITPVMSLDNKDSKKRFKVSKVTYFRLSKVGGDIVQWNNKKTSPQHIICIDSKHSVQGNVLAAGDSSNWDAGGMIEKDQTMDVNATISSDSMAQFRLDDILKDSGMRYLFRMHLSSEFCVENLDVYLEISKFSKKMTILKRLLDSKSELTNKNPSVQHWKSNTKVSDMINSALVKQANECLSIAYHIYSSYIAVGAPYQLNIDHKLRSTISTIMLYPKTNLSQTLGLSVIREGREELIDSIPNSDSVSGGMERGETCHKDNFKTKIIRQSISESNITPLNLHFDNVDSVGNSFQIPPTSPVEVVSHNLELLKKLFSLFDMVARDTYNLMQVDSIPKFLKSHAYLETISSKRFCGVS